eukprot:SAG22_NODE_261_length_13373_cov_17.745472_8_plen_222_part_00
MAGRRRRRRARRVRLRPCGVRGPRGGSGSKAAPVRSKPRTWDILTLASVPSPLKRFPVCCILGHAHRRLRPRLAGPPNPRRVLAARVVRRDRGGRPAGNHDPDAADRWHGRRCVALSVLFCPRQTATVDTNASSENPQGCNTVLPPNCCLSRFWRPGPRQATPTRSSGCWRASPRRSAGSGRRSSGRGGTTGRTGERCSCRSDSLLANEIATVCLRLLNTC